MRKARLLFLIGLGGCATSSTTPSHFHLVIEPPPLHQSSENLYASMNDLDLSFLPAEIRLDRGLTEIPIAIYHLGASFPFATFLFDGREIIVHYSESNEVRAFKFYGTETIIVALDDHELSGFLASRPYLSAEDRISPLFLRNKSADMLLHDRERRRPGFLGATRPPAEFHVTSSPEGLPISIKGQQTDFLTSSTLISRSSLASHSFLNVVYPERECEQKIERIDEYSISIHFTCGDNR